MEIRLSSGITSWFRNPFFSIFLSRSLSVHSVHHEYVLFFVKTRFHRSSAVPKRTRENRLSGKIQGCGKRRIEKEAMAFYEKSISHTAALIIGLARIRLNRG
jgi:hypothetical protein